MKFYKTADSISLTSSGTDPVPRLIGAGVTVFGTEQVMYRHTFLVQLAASVATGVSFLKGFEVTPGKVLLTQHSNADFEQAQQRLSKLGCQLDNLQHEKLKNYRIAADTENPLVNRNGLIERLEGYLKQHSDKGLIILPDLPDITIPLKDMFEKLMESENADETKRDLRTHQFFLYEAQRQSVQVLREFANKHRVSVVTGLNLTTQGRYKLFSSATDADNKIYLLKKKSGWHLNVEDSYYIPSNHWELKYDDFKFFTLKKEDILRMKNINLTPRDRQVVDAMWGNGSMRQTEIIDKSELPPQTVRQRLEALMKPEKGQWIRQDGKQYEVDTSKARPWKEEE